MGPLNQFNVEDVNLLETPEANLCNIMIAADRTIWGRFSDGTLHQFGANNVLNIVGTLDPAGGNIDYPAADAGDIYIFISAGTIGTPAVAVEQGEMLLCVSDSAGGAGVGADFVIYQINIQYATQSVAGIVLLATNAKVESDVDDEAAVTSNKLYYLLQAFGLEWILTDAVKGRSLDGVTPLNIFTQQNPDVAGPQSSIVIQTSSSVNASGVDDSANGGDIYIYTGQPGSTEDGNGGDSGTIYILTRSGNPSTGTGVAGSSGNLQIATGNGGEAQGTGTAGSGGILTVTGGAGGNATVDSNGGAAGGISIQSGIGGEGKGANTGGAGGTFQLRSNRGGHSTDVNGVGGNGSNISVFAGDSGNGNINTGAAGNIILTAANSGSIANGINGTQKSGGSISLISGTGNTSPTGFPGNGGTINITGGIGKPQTVNGGIGSTGSDGGSIRVNSGVGGNGLNSSGQGGSITLSVGTTGSVSDNGATAKNGSDIILTSGNGGAATNVTGNGGNGGNIHLDTGNGGFGATSVGYDGTVVATGFFAFKKIHNNVVAFAGGGFANATRLTGVINRISTVAAPNDSVKLPLTASIEGEIFKVRNDGANSLDVFSSDGVQTINGAVSIAILPGASATIIRMTATELYVFD